MWGSVDRTPVMTFFEDATVKLLLVYMDGKELAAVGEISISTFSMQGCALSFSNLIMVSTIDACPVVVYPPPDQQATSEVQEEDGVLPENPGGQTGQGHHQETGEHRLLQET